MNMEEQFKTELKALLKKYNVVMSIEDVYDRPNVNFYRHGRDNGENFFDWNTTYEDGE